MALPLTVLPLPSVGAEDVLVGPDGRVWTGTDDGCVYAVEPETGVATLVGATGGRPLGLEWLPSGEMLICDAERGLLAMDPHTGEFQPLLHEVDGIPLKFTNNAAVATDGTIWFSDSSRHFGVEQWKSDLIRHTCSGRLLRLGPDGHVETVVLRRVQRVALSGPAAGRAEPWVSGLAGYPDNISRGSDGLIWVTIASPPDPALTVLQKSPSLLRRVVDQAPEALKPKPRRTVRVTAYAPDATLVHDLTFDASHRRRERAPLATFVGHHRVPRVWRATHLAPLAGAPGREVRIPLMVLRDLAEDHPVRKRQGLGIDLAPAGDEHLVRRAGQGQGLGEGVGGLHTRVPPGKGTGDDDAASPRQRPPDGLEGLAAHDQRVTHRGLLEPSELPGDPPGDGAVAADDPAFGDGGDEGEAGHTAIGALIEGCAS